MYSRVLGHERLSTGVGHAWHKIMHRNRAAAKRVAFRDALRRAGVALVLTSASCGLCVGLGAQQSSPPLKPHQEIIVKIRNGKTGSPIWFASPYVFLGNAGPEKLDDSYRRTRFWGDAHVDVSATQPREVRVWVDFIDRDCRYGDDFRRFQVFDYAGRTLRNTPAYDIDTILSTGIVAPNLCGSKTQQPEPGVLTIYVIPDTFKERWND